ncbi:MAG: sporulation protein, partial [Sphingomonas bacterium]
ADEKTRKAAETKAGKAKADAAAKAKDADAATAERNSGDAKGKDAKGKDAKSGKAAKAKDPKDTKDTKGGKSATREAKADGKAGNAADKATSPSGERYWVQVASGSNRADLGKVWGKTRDKAPKLLAGRTTWTTPWKQSNRLLVGPFKSEEEAQGLVNSLGKAGLGGIRFTTEGKAKVEKLDSE